MALHRAGMTPATTNPKYQKIGGKLIGVIFEGAVTTIGGLAPQTNPTKLSCYYQKTLRKWAFRGYTTIFDAEIK